MVTAGSSWRIALCRPGEDPIGHLAAALDAPGVLDEPGADHASTNRVLLEATLRRGSLGLVAAVRQAQLRPDENVLIIVDQFEELFRFRRNRQVQHSREEAVAFVKLLLEAARETVMPIYVVLTMRSDFIGDCMEYPGLPEAINQSHYLVPRMARDALRAVITGPVAVAGGAIAPRLVVRLLNDLGDNQDELPLLQHVLMRMWDRWQRHRSGAGPIDVADYEAVGTLREALSQHVEEAYAEVGGDVVKKQTERMFKALTDTFTDPRGIRRPTTIAELAEICQVPEREIVRIVEIFRREGRSFLMPPPPVELTPRTVVDLSHESLMRGWTRLIRWAQEERAAAGTYVRLSREAAYFAEGAAALWGDPELALGLRWRRENSPTAAWARRFDDRYDAAIDFLDRSERECARQRAARRAERLRRLQLAWGVASVLLILFVVATWQALVARREGRRAATNFGLATTAVDELLASVERNQASVGADVPQMEDFRRELLERAQRFYAEFIKQQPTDEQLLGEMGLAHFRLGHIHRMLDNPTQAEAEYRSSVAQFEDLARRNPAAAEYRRSLASAHNWLGETLRPVASQHDAAEREYGRALALQRELAAAAPGEAAYRQELARTLYNRGILYSSADTADEAAFARGETDFREAIRLLEGVVDSSGGQAAQELARAYNNLAALLSEKPSGVPEARQRYERAIAIHAGLIDRPSRTREQLLEMAKFSNNYAELLRQLRELGPARLASDRALRIIEELGRPAPSLGIELADAHNLRARILEAEGSPDAWSAYREALNTYSELVAGGVAPRLQSFHWRFGDLLMNLAAAQRSSAAPEAGRLLTQALAVYADAGQRAVAAGDRATVQEVSDNLTRLAGGLPDGDRARVAVVQESLKKALAGAPTP
jgi:tetratricopeptide (TPR) repeat protein